MGSGVGGIGRGAGGSGRLVPTSPALRRCPSPRSSPPRRRRAAGRPPAWLAALAGTCPRSALHAAGGTPGTAASVEFRVRGIWVKGLRVRV